MKHLIYKNNWPDSWKMRYSYDLQEIYGELKTNGYAYAYRNRFDHTLALCKSTTNQNARVLDVAAGQGNFSLSLAEMGFNVMWNDIQTDLIEYVKLKYDYGKIKYTPGNILDLKFDKLFDLILITEVIEHVAFPNLFLKHIAKLVAPGGNIIMTTPNGHYFGNKLPKFTDYNDPSVFEKNQFGPDADDHIFALHLDEIYDFGKEAKLEVEDIKFFNNSLTCGHFKLGIILKFLPIYFVKLLEKITMKLPLYFRKKLNISIAVVYHLKN